MNEKVKIGTFVVVDDKHVRRVTHVTPTGRIHIEESYDEYRPMEQEEGRWRHAGARYGRFGLRDVSYARLATPDESERYRLACRASALRPRITEALRTADPYVVFHVAEILGVKGD